MADPSIIVELPGLGVGRSAICCNHVAAYAFAQLMKMLGSREEGGAHSMILEYLLPLIAAVIASIGLFLSRPERRRVAFVTAALTLCLGAWQSYGQFLSDRTSDVIERRAVQELSGATATFLNMLSEAIFRSSDGWLPTTEEEFFSARTAELICTHLNGQARAPVYPDQPWWFFASESAAIGGRFSPGGYLSD